MRWDCPAWAYQHEAFAPPHRHGPWCRKVEDEE